MRSAHASSSSSKTASCHTLRYGTTLDEEAPIALDEELNLADLGQLDRYDRFEAALVVNEAAGVMGVLVVADDEASYTAPAGIAPLKKLTGADVAVANNWAEWKDAIRDEEPSLLVLLPHSEPEHPTTEMPALEIGGDLASAGWIKAAHVAKPGVAPPVVLLFGCTTTITELPFQNFAEAFKQEGAAVVIGTLSIVLGRHAATFAIELLKLLHASAGKGVKFGDVLLDARRRRVAAGDPFALSLIAYGDASVVL